MTVAVPPLHPLAPDDPAVEEAVLRATAARSASATLLHHARHDPATFAVVVLRDEETARRVKLAPVHTRWHDAMTKETRLVLWSHVEAGKTNQVSIARVLFEVGRNPDLRVAIISSTTGAARKIVRVLAQYITESPDLHAVFPRLRPATRGGQPWNQTMLTVERTVIAKDPTIQAVGPRGHIIGSRLDLVILDDFLDEGNTRTPEDLEAMYRWLRRILAGRLTQRARVWCIGNAWHPRDAMHRLVSESGYQSMVCPVITSDGVLTWPERWSQERIAIARRDLGPAEYARQLLCQARDDAESRFRREWLDAALRKGAGYELVSVVDELPPGFAIFTGVDLGVARHNAADPTAIATILVYPHDHPELPRARQLLWMETGRWTFPEIVARIEAHGQRYGGPVIVENNAAQNYLVQYAQQQGSAQVVPFTTGKNKVDPALGIEGLASEFDQELWIFPSDVHGRLTADPEVEALVREILFYRPPPAHTGDRLMSLWFAQFAARKWEARRMSGRLPAVGSRPGGGARVLGG